MSGKPSVQVRDSHTVAGGLECSEERTVESERIFSVNVTISQGRPAAYIRAFSLGPCIQPQPL